MGRVGFVGIGIMGSRMAARLLDAGHELTIYNRTASKALAWVALNGNQAAVAAYPDAAQRGLKIFVGKGACNVCHIGPAFTNGEFHDTGIPFFIEKGRVDPGRHAGIQKLRA